MDQTKMAAIENLKISNGGYELSMELKNVPVSFPNALRRITLSQIPTVVIRDVQILENTTQLPHEMLQHRVEMLPVNVMPDDASTIRDAKIEIRMKIDKDKGVYTVTTDDFVIEAGRNKILMRDRDFDTPLLFLRMRPNESIHIKARLALENTGVSQVCTSTFSWHPDPERVVEDKKLFVEGGGDPRVFDNFYYQRSYSRDDAGRPNWFDFSVESVGVVPAKDILKIGVAILRKELAEYMTDAENNIQREQDEGSYKITVERGGHTIGALLQEVMYSDSNINFVSYDFPHPLRTTMIIRLNTKKTPESILKTARNAIEEYCSVVEKAL